MLINPKPATLYRYGIETQDPDTGRTIKPAATEVDITGSFQPISGTERAALPEGIRSSARWKVYTETELQTSDQFDKTPADEIVYLGDRYVVGQVEPRQSLIPHYKGYLIREKEVPT